MKRFLLGFGAMILVILVMKGQAVAETVIWTDYTYSWGNSYYGNWGTAAENGTEVIGGPKISGGQVIITDAGFLSSITANFTDFPASKTYWADLFLDLGGDGTWDYVLSAGYDGNPKYVPDASVTLYQITGTFTVSQYIVTNQSDSYWSGWNIRDNHPFAFLPDNDDISKGFGSISVASGTLTYALPAGMVNVIGSDFLKFGFAENCSNDVVLEQIPVPAPPAVPEPGTLLLLGTGLAAVAVFGRKRFGR